MHLAWKNQIKDPWIIIAAWYKLSMYAIAVTYLPLSGSNLLGSNSIGLSKYCGIRHMTDDAIYVQ